MNWKAIGFNDVVTGYAKAMAAVHHQNMNGHKIMAVPFFKSFEGIEVLSGLLVSSESLDSLESLKLVNGLHKSIILDGEVEFVFTNDVKVINESSQYRKAVNALKKLGLVGGLMSHSALKGAYQKGDLPRESIVVLRESLIRYNAFNSALKRSDIPHFWYVSASHEKPFPFYVSVKDAPMKSKDDNFGMGKVPIPKGLFELRMKEESLGEKGKAFSYGILVMK